MECLYIPELESSSREITIEGEEFRHLRALRLREGESVMLTSGKGICAIAKVINYSKNEARASVTEVLPNYGENSVRCGVGIGILDSRERMEFALEKSIELGVTDFYPILCEFSQKQKVSIDRLIGKAIAAVKQCKRSILPVIHQPVTIEELLKKSNEWSRIIVGDANGEHVNNDNRDESLLVLVGAEGGFSPKEISSLQNDPRTTFISLGNRRLRAETAAIAALCLLT